MPIHRLRLCKKQYIFSLFLKGKYNIIDKKGVMSWGWRQRRKKVVLQGKISGIKRHVVITESELEGAKQLTYEKYDFKDADDYVFGSYFKSVQNKRLFGSMCE